MRFFLALALVTASLAAPLAARAATYEIDPAHTYAGFAVEHMMVSSVHGAFTDVAGKITLDPAKIADTKADVTINAVSIDTRLRSATITSRARTSSMSRSSRR